MSIDTSVMPPRLEGDPGPGHEEGEGQEAPRGAASQAHVRLFDFRLPDSLDRAHVHALQMMFEVFTHRISGVMATQLRVPVTVRLGELSQRSWEDFSASLPEPAYLVSVGLVPLAGRLMLHLPLELAMTLVDLRLGGSGKGRFPDRAPNDIEQRLVGEVAGGIVAELPAVFAPLATVSVGSLSYVASVQFLPSARRNDMYLVVELAVELGEGRSFTCGIAFPFTALHPIIDVLAKQEMDEPSSTETGASATADRLLEAPIEVSVRFPPTTLTPTEFLSLAAGDVIRLPYEQGASLALVAERQNLIEVLPTTRGKRLACIVTESEGDYQ
ncbi:MAG: flagellar motor switch protein FliM [Acidimicrobiales bacterium]